MEQKLHYANVVYRNELYKVYWNPETKNALIEKDVDCASGNVRASGTNHDGGKERQMPVNIYRGK